MIIYKLFLDQQMCCHPELNQYILDILLSVKSLLEKVCSSNAQTKSEKVVMVNNVGTKL